GSRCVSSICDIATDGHVFWEFELFGKLINNAHVGLVWGKCCQVSWLDPRISQGLFGNFRHLPDSPAEDRRTFLAQGWPDAALATGFSDRGSIARSFDFLDDIAHVQVGTSHADHVPFLALGSPVGF